MLEILKKLDFNPDQIKRICCDSFFAADLSANIKLLHLLRDEFNFDPEEIKKFCVNATFSAGPAEVADFVRWLTAPGDTGFTPADASRMRYWCTQWKKNKEEVKAAILDCTRLFDRDLAMKFLCDSVYVAHWRQLLPILREMVPLFDKHKVDRVFLRRIFRKAIFMKRARLICNDLKKSTNFKEMVNALWNQQK